MNPDLALLHPYPFERLAKLKQGIEPATTLEHIALSIGEPAHPAPAFVVETLLAHLHGLSNYPLTKGSPMLREAIAGWLQRRFGLGDGGIDPETQVLPVAGTREALFSFAQAVVERRDDPLVLMPNPFYQIYEGAALLAGAQPRYLNCLAENGFLPDLDEVGPKEWDRCQLLYLCSPGNPTGAVADAETLARIIDLAHKHDFIIASDECYSEIYFDEDNPPMGLLQAAKDAGNDRYERCVVFHSLSKRSNLPGLRSGFVAGDASVLQAYLRYRTYHGCALPPPTQAASVSAWSDEAHVVHNRSLYKQKFAAVLDTLAGKMDISLPDAGFYLWPKTPVEDTEFARRLFAQENVTVLPGRFLSRPTPAGDPGEGRVRMALVAPLDECVDAAQRIARLLDGL
ncbi:MAG: succinyldiaminopimelate transaminase [Chromatiales bacterium]|nr:succinyldiaminopimelate transaminase [Chromatiales bacterium]